MERFTLFQKTAAKNVRPVTFAIILISLFCVSLVAQTLQVVEYGGGSNSEPLPCVCLNEASVPESTSAHSQINGLPCTVKTGAMLRQPEDVEALATQRRICDGLFGLTSRNEPAEYVYKLILRNETNNRIQAVDWDYCLLDPQTKAEVSRHQFSSNERLEPRARKTLVAYSVSPPTRTISAGVLSRPASEQFIEKVVIRHVTFADGTIWKPMLEKTRSPR